MNQLIAFGLGVATGFIALVAIAVLLAYRDGHPFGEFIPDDPHDVYDDEAGKRT